VAAVQHEAGTNECCSNKSCHVCLLT
jgi:hypothetical protein